MATTQNTYTGDNSTVSYSFTFPYLEETDIKVSLDGVVTTAYTLSNATTVTFNTAPGTGVAIRIYRDTNNDALAATFFAGSAIRAQDLNDDFLQNAYVTQEVKNRYLDKSTGGTITGNLDMNGNKVVDLGAPTAATDAATKGYIDGLVLSATIPDGDRGDITVSASGATWTIDNGLAATKLSFTQSGTGAVARTVDSKLKDVVSVKDFGAVGDGVTNDSAAFTAAITAHDVILVPSGTYLLNGTVTATYDKTIILQGTLDCTGASTAVLLSGPIDVQGGGFVVTYAANPADQTLKIRNSDTTSFNQYINSLNPLWFSGSDIGAQINNAFQCGGNKTCVSVPCGTYDLTTTINLNENVNGQQLALRGQSTMSPTFTMGAGSALVGISTYGSDEAYVENVRVIETAGARTGVGILLGGTSLTVANCWFSNTKYGMLLNGGQGMHVSNIYSEACDYGLLCGARFADYSISGMVAGSSVLNDRFHECYFFNCGAGNNLTKSGLRVSNYSALTVSGVTGTVAEGDTLTTAGGATVPVVSINSAKTLICVEIDELSGSFSLPETFTTTSGGSGTIVSAQTNQIKALDFSQLAVVSNDRNGAYISNGLGLTIQGQFRNNGTNAASTSAGIYSAPNSVATVTVCNTLFADQEVSGGAGGYGVDIRNGQFSFLGCQFANQQGTNQSTGIRQSSGTVHATGCIFSSITTPTTGTITKANCFGSNVVNSNPVAPVSTPFDFDAGPINAATVTVVTNQPLTDGQQEFWQCYGHNSNNTIASFYELNIINEGGTITALSLSNGTGITFAVVDNGNNTYNITATNPNTNNRYAKGYRKSYAS